MDHIAQGQPLIGGKTDKFSEENIGTLKLWSYTRSKKGSFCKKADTGLLLQKRQKINPQVFAVFKLKQGPHTYTTNWESYDL